VHLQLGLAEIVPAFLPTSFAPVAFFAVALDLYSSTGDALKLLDAKQGTQLPRIYCYFAEIIGYTYCD
jgi:hypothetical protein